MPLPEEVGFARLVKSSEPDADGGGIDKEPGKSGADPFPC
jgi:hypothetical protein